MIQLPIHGNTLSIRLFEESDFVPFLSFMLNKSSTQFLMFSEDQKTEAGAKELFDYVVNSYGSPEHIHSYAIVDKLTNVYVGSCGFSPYSDGIVECYFSINEEFTGQGYATKALSLLIDSLPSSFEVRAYCSPENKAAHSVLVNCKFSSNGLSKHAHFETEGLLFTYQK
ncbi:GNAT family N-acetyltransferase [Vibrio cholerae]|uniref:GNAT family N-acetyltransferase n=1 Tax=Vibrio cholerae TaxID=666 RepID=UPI000E0C165D|nr:GNAT family protein [Vibrio cholerae]MCD1196861.1 hypothetical protein [Vibrio cholerae]MCD1200607.1 hypothetical protein [Vibrio cholerae]